MAERLTDAIVKGLTCPPGKKDALYTDAVLPGFSVRVNAGGTKVFLLQYRAAGKVKRLVLGTWGAEMTCADARRKAEQARGRVREGKDPLADRKATDKAARAAAAVERLTVDRLVNAWKTLHLSERSESYALEAPRRLKARMAKFLQTPAADLTKADVIALLDATKGEQGAKAANRLRAHGHACWDWAVKRGDVEGNPWAATPKPAKEQSRERVLSDRELAAVWHAAERLGHPWRPIIRLLILTGQRRSEVAALPWAELDMEHGTWTIAADRAKNHRLHQVPLSPQAIEIIAQMPRLDGATLAFQNARDTAPSGFGRMKANLDGLLGEGVPPWTLHDLRRTCATGMQKLGERLEVIEAVLNHVSGSRGGIVGVYQRHGWDQEKRAALARWADHVCALPKPQTVASPTALRQKQAGRPPATLGEDFGTLLEVMKSPESGGRSIARKKVKSGKVGSEQSDAFVQKVNRVRRKIKDRGVDIANVSALEVAMGDTMDLRPDVGPPGVAPDDLRLTKAPATAHAELAEHMKALREEYPVDVILAREFAEIDKFFGGQTEKAEWDADTWRAFVRMCRSRILSRYSHITEADIDRALEDGVRVH